MKLYIPAKLLRYLMVFILLGHSMLFAADAQMNGIFSLAAEQYPNGNATYTTRQTYLLLSKYDELVFSGISFYAWQAGMSGGAITHTGYTYARTAGLNDNNDVLISENKIVGNQVEGGAINNSNAFTLNANNTVTFSGNIALASTSGATGGAIANQLNGEFDVNDNGTLSFTGNIATSAAGAIFNRGSFRLLRNNEISFKNNYASSSGGAIYNQGGTLALTNNGNISFSYNSLASTDKLTSSVYGGAIDTSGDVTLNNNGIVTFSNNSARVSDSAPQYAVAYGGAIYICGESCVNINENEEVIFSDNSANKGGAIFNMDGSLSLKGNGNVSFSGNKATLSVSSVKAMGGAICNFSTFSLSENGNVLFAKNLESDSGVYRLRSIYSTNTLNLSATEGKNITFRDSIYATGIVNLNQEGTGDIIFTGATTESDLKELKGEDKVTEQEISDSRTSELAVNAKLYGGRLVVMDKATLIVNGLTVADEASVVVKDGLLTLNSGKATVTAAEEAEKAVLVGTSLREGSLSGSAAKHRGVVDGALIHLADDGVFSMQHLVLSAITHVVADPATLKIADVTAELMLGVNATLTGNDTLFAGTRLTDGKRAYTLSEDATVMQLEAATFDSVTLTGSSLVLDLAGMEVDIFDGADYIAVSFTNGIGYASFDTSLGVTLSLNGVNYKGVYLEQEDKKKSLYFCVAAAEATPEPETTALSLLALAGLGVRRKRR